MSEKSACLPLGLVRVLVLLGSLGRSGTGRSLGLFGGDLGHV